VLPRTAFVKILHMHYLDSTPWCKNYWFFQYVNKFWFFPYATKQWLQMPNRLWPIWDSTSCHFEILQIDNTQD
jgi:hypothetical protein